MLAALLSVLAATIIITLYCQAFYNSQHTPSLKLVGRISPPSLSNAHTHPSANTHTNPARASALINHRWRSGYCYSSPAKRFSLSLYSSSHPALPFYRPSTLDHHLLAVSWVEWKRSSCWAWSAFLWLQRSLKTSFRMVVAVKLWQNLSLWASKSNLRDSYINVKVTQRQKVLKSTEFFKIKDLWRY